MTNQTLGRGSPSGLRACPAGCVKRHFSANRRSSWSVRWLDNGQVESQQRTQRQPLLSPTCSTSSSTSSPLSSCSPDNANSDSVCNQSSSPDIRSSLNAKPPIWRDLFNRTTLTLLITYLVFQLSNISFNSLYPIFAAAHPPVGRGLSPGNIGVSLSGAGIATILFQACVYQSLKAYAGNLGTYRLALFGIAVSMVLMPWLGYLEDGRIWLYVELGLVLVLKNICAIGGLSSVMLLITNSTPSRANLGTLNGVAQTLSALGRSFGPFASGGLFTFSLKVRPKVETVAWSIFGGLALIGWVGTLFIDGEGLESEDWSDSEDDSIHHSDEPCDVV